MTFLNAMVTWCLEFVKPNIKEQAYAIDQFNTIAEGKLPQ